MLLYHRVANKTAMLRRLLRAVRGQIMPARENQYACRDLSEYKKKIISGQNSHLPSQNVSSKA